MNATARTPLPHAVPLVAVGGAVAAGAIAAASPGMALALLAACLLLFVALRAPVANLLLIVFLTAIVPYAVQQRAGLGGSTGRPGLLASDVLLFAGILRGIVMLPDMRLPGRVRLVAGLMVAVLVVGAIQFVHGLRGPNVTSEVGAEFRVLLGFGTLIAALPILADATARRRLLRGLVAIGLALGAWAIVQWVANLPFTVVGDVGVRSGIRLTTSGTGQLQGGLFAFPVAATLAFAALLASDWRSPLRRALLLAVLALNCVGLLWTYERTFWIATVTAMAFVVLRSGPVHRVRAALLAPALVAGVLGGFALAAPGDLTAARQRLLSIGQYGTDSSLTYRTVESRHVLDQIRERPIAGSGFGASMLWGPPFPGVHPTVVTYSHNGYLWLAWKIGIPGAAMLVLLLVLAITARGPPAGPTTFGSVRTGAQAGLLALLLASVTFPSFNALSITAAMGLLAAIAVMPPPEPRPAAAPEPAAPEPATEPARGPALPTVAGAH